MNAVEIYERCKSKELITSFNRSGLCISYKSMKRHREDLEKHKTPIIKPSKSDVPPTNVKDLYKLPCQQINQIYSDRVLKLSDEFTPEKRTL